MAAAKVSKTQERLNRLEKEIKGRGVRLGYERLEYAGLRLKSGLCWFRGAYYLFVDRLKTVNERIEHIEAALDELDELAAQSRLDQPGGPGEAAPVAVDLALATEPAAEPAAAEALPEPAPAVEDEAAARPGSEASHDPR